MKIITGYHKGFTLIEMLVVIFIIGLLASIILPNFMGARERAQDAAKKQAMNALKNSLRLYYNDNQSYPALSGVDFSSTFYDNYMPSVPASDRGVYLTKNAITYTRLNNNNSFTLSTTLSSTAGDDDINSQSNCGVSSPTDGVFMVCSN